MNYIKRALDSLQSRKRSKTSVSSERITGPTAMFSPPSSSVTLLLQFVTCKTSASLCQSLSSYPSYPPGKHSFTWHLALQKCNEINDYHLSF